MENILKPKLFDTSPDSKTADKEWTHWLCTLENFLEETKVKEDGKKLKILINFLSFSNYEYISECTSYNSAIELLQKTFVKQKK